MSDATRTLGMWKKELDVEALYLFLTDCGLNEDQASDVVGEINQYVKNHNFDGTIYVTGKTPKRGVEISMEANFDGKAYFVKDGRSDQIYIVLNNFSG